jgi:hypothetical protein
MGKTIGLIFAGVFLGFTFATAILFPQIQNREAMGRNHGFTNGAFHVIRFLSKNLKSNKGKAGQETGQFLDLKATRLTVVKINGIKTIRVDE